MASSTPIPAPIKQPNSQDPLVATQGTSSTGDTGGIQIGQMQTVNAAQIDQTQEAQFRAQQQAFATQLQNQINGVGPSLAGLQYQQASDANIAQQMAVANSGGGALARRTAANNVATLGQQAALGSAQTRIQEEQNAQSQLGNVLNAGRTSDIGLAENQAQLTQGATLSNQAAVNQRTLSQADIARSISQAKINASAITGAASISANASMYATDAANYRFNEGESLTQDQNAVNNTTNATAANYAADNNYINAIIASQKQANANMNAAGTNAAAGANMGGGAPMASNSNLNTQMASPPSSFGMSSY